LSLGIVSGFVLKVVLMGSGQTLGDYVTYVIVICTMKIFPKMHKTTTYRKPNEY